MCIDAIQLMLTNKLGLDPESIGSLSITSAIKERIKKLRINEIKEYYDILCNSPDELSELSLSLTVPETWFFREFLAFEFLKQFVKTEWLARSSSEKLRILSIPCATGEEPYSISIMLLESGMKPEAYCVDAVDINPEYLKTARKGIYGSNSFRGDKTVNINGYFREIDEKTFQLKEEIIKSVHFMTGNIIDPLFLNGFNVYHIIFCRNLFIYLTYDARQIIMKKFDRLLREKGILLAGATETFSFQGYRFLQPPLSFVHRRDDATQRNSASIKENIEIKKNEIIHTNKVKLFSTEDLIIDPLERQQDLLLSEDISDEKILPESGQTREYMPESFQSPSSDDILAEAQKLADQGLLKEAASLCDESIKKQGPKASCYFLLGLIKKEEGNDHEAEECFNKTLYLDSNNYDAIMHLIYLSKKRGDNDTALILQKRAERIKTKVQ